MIEGRCLSKVQPRGSQAKLQGGLPRPLGHKPWNEKDAVPIPVLGAAWAIFSASASLPVKQERTLRDTPSLEGLWGSEGRTPFETKVTSVPLPPATCSGLLCPPSSQVAAVISAGVGTTGVRILQEHSKMYPATNHRPRPLGHQGADRNDKPEEKEKPPTSASPCHSENRLFLPGEPLGQGWAHVCMCDMQGHIRIGTNKGKDQVCLHQGSPQARS